MILVFGSINADVVMPVPHLPAPGETVLGGDYVVLPGGKGANQALAARRAGATVAMAGAVGRDAFAEVALGSLRRDGVDLGLVALVEHPTGAAAIFVGGDGENMIAVASGANLAVASEQVPDALLGPDTVVVAQLEVPVEATAALLHRAHGAGARTMLNLAPATPLPPGLLREIELLVANAGEAATLGAAPEAVARELRGALIVTRGAAGATAFLRDGGQIAVSALPIAPLDTTGAGDTFVGVLAAGLDSRIPLDLALRQASVAAGLACLGRGAQSAMPRAAEIDAAVAKLG